MAYGTVLYRQQGPAQSSAPQPPAGKEPPASFLVIFVASYLVILAVVLVLAALGIQWREWFPGSERDRSLFGAVGAAVYTLMSHLT